MPPEAPTVVNQEFHDLAPLAVKETKPGVKTTEFWLTTTLSVLTLLGTFPLPPKFEAFVAAGLTGVYTISRGLAKAGVPDVPTE